MKEASKKSKDWFDRMHRLRPRKIEEGAWVLVYNSSLHNHHRSMQENTRWFRSYAITSANDNATYHLMELDETRMVVPVMGKKFNVIKK